MKIQFRRGLNADIPTLAEGEPSVDTDAPYKFWIGTGGGNREIIHTGTIDFVDGGEAGGGKRTLGNTDANALGFITNNTDVILMSAAGEVTMPLQPCILVENSLDDDNETGDGTAFTVIFDSEIFDQNADFDGTSTFTASVTGRYLVCFTVQLEEVGAGHTTIQVNIVTTNRSYEFVLGGGNSIDASGSINISGSKIVDMTATDTLTITIQVSGGAKTVDISGAGMSTSLSIGLFA